MISAEDHLSGNIYTCLFLSMKVSGGGLPFFSLIIASCNMTPSKYLEGTSDDL
jgi:hypothetical protein